MSESLSRKSLASSQEDSYDNNTRAKVASKTDTEMKQLKGSSYIKENNVTIHLCDDNNEKSVDHNDLKREGCNVTHSSLQAEATGGYSGVNNDALLGQSGRENDVPVKEETEYSLAPGQFEATISIKGTESKTENEISGAVNVQVEGNEHNVNINTDNQVENKEDTQLEPLSSRDTSSQSRKSEDNISDVEKKAALAKLRKVKTNDDDNYDNYNDHCRAPTNANTKSDKAKIWPSYNRKLAKQRLAKAKEKYTYFWKSKEVFSQWHPSKFTVDGKKFTCAEQYMMYQKAVLFGSDDIAKKILYTSDPRKMKSLGRQVKQFTDDLWRSNCLHVVKRASTEKFTQNEKLKKILFCTHPTILVEASPFDKVWGIGVVEQDERAWDESTWDGLNLLGYILTEVRDELMIKEGRITEELKINTPGLEEKLKLMSLENDFGTPVEDNYKWDPSSKDPTDYAYPVM